jgi:hypothetical protein
MEPGEHVVGVGAGDIDADVELHAAVLGDQMSKPIAQLGIAGGGLDDFEFAGGL